MKYKPGTLAEALALRHENSYLMLSFAENDETDNCILLSELPEIDLCFEDHGHYIFGLNLLLSSLVSYLKERDKKLAIQLKPILANCRPDALLGEFLYPPGMSDLFINWLAGCKAKLKTYDGTHGREIPFASKKQDRQTSFLQTGELPLLILFPK